ncbi:MAG: flavin reductase family protein [Streptosporangiaceae bacterium]
MTEFIAAMANAATGVTVVVTDGPGGRMAQTISAMCSVSADPPTLLVAVNRRSPLTGVMAINKVFCVNVLAEHQAYIADTFAGRRGERSYDFGGASWRDPMLLAESAASFSCVLARTIAVGTHLLFVGEVTGSSASGHAPLAYHDRGYRRLTTSEETYR